MKKERFVKNSNFPSQVYSCKMLGACHEAESIHDTGQTSSIWLVACLMNSDHGRTGWDLAEWF